MTPLTAHASLENLVADLFAGSRSSRLLVPSGLVLALAAHALVAGLAPGGKQRIVKEPPAVEVELTPAEPPPSLPEPVREEVTAEAPATPVKVALAAPLAAAPAARLLTAKADADAAKPADGPVDFTNDPNVLGFGAGVVAVGGKAIFGLAGARATFDAAPGAATAPGGAPGESLVAAGDLARKPSLGESDPCRGFFPQGAVDDVANAAVRVVIAKNGAVTLVQVLSESPRAQGFGAAARACMLGKRFSPGLDKAGNPAATAVRVNVRFSR